MALATVRHLERLPAGAIPRDIVAKLRLIASTTGDEHGFVTGAYTAIGGDRIQHPDAAGLFTFTSVNPNTGDSDDVVDLPAGTRYGLSIWQNVGGRQRRIGTELILEVQDTDEDQYTTDILSDLPDDLLSSAAAAAIAAEAAARADADELLIPFGRVTPGPEGRALVADPATADGIRVRYPSPKGPRVCLTGTSIEIGSGGDSTYNGPYVPGRPSNADVMQHACGNSGGKIRYHKNNGVGGQTLGGIAYLLADAPIGSATIDVGDLELGPALPYESQSVFIDLGGDDQEGVYVDEVEVIDGGVRITALTATTVAHAAGDQVRWGMIGFFESSFPDEGTDIGVIGGPTNDLDHLTADGIAAGQQVLAELYLDRDAVPVVTTICARPNLHDETDAANAAIRANAELHGHWCLDYHRVTADPATRAFKTDLCVVDGVHPNQEGAVQLAQEWHDAFVDHVEIRRDSRRRPTVDSYSLNAVPYSTFSSGDNGQVGGNYGPKGWTVKEFFSTGITVSIVPPRLTDNIEGNLLRITASGGQGTRGSQAVIPIAASGALPGFETGDLVFLEAFARLEGFKPDGYAQAFVTLVAVGNLGAVTLPCLYGWIRDYPGGIFTSQASVIPTTIGTLSSLSVQAYIVGPALAGPNSGYGVLEVGEVTVANLTRGTI